MKRILFASILILPATATAQTAAETAAETAEEANRRPARSMRLVDVLSVAVRQNPTLAESAIDVAISQSDILSARGVDDWTLTAEGEVLSIQRPIVTGEPFQITDDDSVDVSVAIARGLPTGGTLGVEVGGIVRDSSYAVIGEDGSPFATESRTMSASAVATLNQPLLQGYGRDVSRASIRQAQAKRTVVTAQRAIDAIEVVREVINLYWELAYTAREIEIQKQSLGLAQEQLRITRAAINAGAVAPTEVTAVEQAIATREQTILGAEIQLQERAVQIRRLAGLEIGVGEISLQAADVLDAPEREYDLDKVLAVAAKSNPQIILLEVSGAGAKIDVEVAEDRVRPRLDLAASAGPNSTRDNGSDLLGDISGLKGYTVSARLTYTQILGNRAATGTVERAEAQTRKLKLDLATARREIAVSVVQTVNTVRLARKRIEVADKAIKLAEQNVGIEQRRFQVGEATNFDVLQRQEELAQARLSHARAQVDYLQAVTEVDALTGDLLTRHGMKVQDD